MNKILLSYLMILGIASAAGAGTGVVLKRTLGPVDEVYPPGFSVEEYKDDTNDLYDRYVNKGESITKFSNSDLVNIALEKYKRCNNSYSYGIGTAHTIIEQTIRSAQIKNGDNYFEEQISYSNMVAVANRSIQEGANRSIKEQRLDPKLQNIQPMRHLHMTKKDIKTSWASHWMKRSFTLFPTKLH